MRRMMVAGIVLACAAFIAGGAVQGQRQVGLEAAPTRTATPVEVINFPEVQPVNGTVSVGNLPLDADGNVRVGPSPAPPTYRFTKIIDGAILEQPNTTFESVPVAGWRQVGLLVRVTVLLDVPVLPDGTDATCLAISGAFGGDGVFPPGASLGTASCYRRAGDSDVFQMFGPVIGPELQLKTALLDAAFPFVPMGARIEAWLYLSN